MYHYALEYLCVVTLLQTKKILFLLIFVLALLACIAMPFQALKLYFHILEDYLIEMGSYTFVTIQLVASKWHFVGPTQVDRTATLRRVDQARSNLYF